MRGDKGYLTLQVAFVELLILSVRKYVGWIVESRAKVYHTSTQHL